MATYNGNDTLNDTISATAGASDVLNGLGGNDILSGNDFDDTINGGAGTDQLFGGTGNDLLNGGAGDDAMDGGDGIDTLDYTGSTAGVLVNLSSGSAEGGWAVGDTFSLVENLTGSALNDTLTGDTNNNVLTGAAGDDVLNGGLGQDTMIGGTGNDSFVVDDAGDEVAEAASAGTDLVTSSISYTLGANLENLTLSGTQNIDATGNELANVLTGNNGTGGFIGTTGNNYLSGLGGNDTLIGNDGVDTLDGGTGNDSMVGGDFSDVYIVDAAGDAVVELTGEGEDRVEASINYTLGSFVEDLTLTGIGNLTGTGNIANNQITGNTGNNLLSGSDGNDTLRGDQGNDTLDGGNGNDSMIGGLGDDQYYVAGSQDKVVENADEGIDTVISSMEAYTLALRVENLTLTSTILAGTGNGEDNTITANALSNTLLGMAGNDTITAGDGNDTLNGGSGVDSLVGGTGNDVYVVDNLNDVVSETGGSGTADRVETTVDYTLGAGLENLTALSSGDTELTGNELANTLTGAAGDNLMMGMAGVDTLVGGAGDDTLNGGDGADSMVGGTGNDVYQIDSITETIVELAAGGTDTVEVGASFTLAAEFENLVLTGASAINGTGNGVVNRLTGNGAANLLSGLAGNDTIVANAGNDTLDGGTGADSMTGGLGDDHYVLDDIGDKTVELSTGGNDTVSASISHALVTYIEHLTLTGTGNINGVGNNLSNALVGNSGNNALVGDIGNDTLTGNAGNDGLNGGAGNDVMTGGSGNDTYYVDSAQDVVVETAANGTDSVNSAITYTLLDNFENLTLAGTSAINGTGNAVANVITGNTGNNILSGLAGDDTLVGGAGADKLDGGTGNDSMTGGAGNDNFIIDSAGDVAVEAVDGGIDTITTVFSTTLATDFENLILTGVSALDGVGNTVANKMFGNAAANDLDGLAGNDTISGGDGDDTIDGGTGTDSMLGGLGDDYFFVDATTDVIVESTTGGADIAFSSASGYTLATGVERLILLGTASINGVGNSSANRLDGNSGNNRLLGDAGNDSIYGNGGADTLDGGVGNDIMVGGLGDDVYVISGTGDLTVESAASGTDTVVVGTHWTLAANVENMIFTGTGALNGTGNAEDNRLTGNAGANRLLGLDGADTLIGGAGADTMTGGTGADHFVFTAASASLETITDFNDVEGGAEEGDVLELIGLLTGTFSYLGTAAFTGGSDDSEARVNTATGQVLIDTNGDGAVDITIAMTGLTTAAEISASDFLWI